MKALLAFGVWRLALGAWRLALGGWRLADGPKGLGKLSPGFGLGGVILRASPRKGAGQCLGIHIDRTQFR